MLLQPSDTVSHYRFICQGILELFLPFFFPSPFFTFPWSCILDKSAQINIEYPHLNVSFRGKISIHELHLNYYPTQFSCNMTPERSSELNKPYGHQKGMTQQLNGEKQKSSIKSLSGDNLFCLSNLVLH